MKLKFKLFSLMIIFCIIVSFAVVLASANEVEFNNDDNASSLSGIFKTTLYAGNVIGK